MVVAAVVIIFNSSSNDDCFADVIRNDASSVFGMRGQNLVDTIAQGCSVSS